MMVLEIVGMKSQPNGGRRRRILIMEPVGETTEKIKAWE